MANNQQKKGRKLFIIAFIVFLTVMILLVIDMASRTTAPWNKSPETPSDSLVQDSLTETRRL